MVIWRLLWVSASACYPLPYPLLFLEAAYTPSDPHHSAISGRAGMAQRSRPEHLHTHFRRDSSHSIATKRNWAYCKTVRSYSDIAYNTRHRFIENISGVKLMRSCQLIRLRKKMVYVATLKALNREGRYTYQSSFLWLCRIVCNCCMNMEYGSCTYVKFLLEAGYW